MARPKIEIDKKQFENMMNKMKAIGVHVGKKI